MSDVARIELAQTVRASLAEDQVLTPAQARSFVRAIQTSWQVNTLEWGVRESDDTLSQAIRLIHAARILDRLDGGSHVEATLAYRRAGELFEWLSRSNDELRKTLPLALFAAGSYQLGGLPAMATGLLRQTAYADTGLQLFAAFLGASFDEVLEKCTAFWTSNPQLTARNAGATYFGSAAFEDMSWLATVELVRCLGLASHSLRKGNDERFEAALEHIRRVEKFLVRAAPDDIAILAFFLRSAFERFGKASVYTSMRRLGALQPANSSYLERFARKQFERGRGLLWSSQQQGLDRLLHESSFALCTPTGSGKTMIANMAIVKELLLLAQNAALAPLALYLVPSRALAGEVEAKLTSELGREFVVTGLYGGADWGITDAWLTTDLPTVLIATVEKADALLRYVGPMLLARLRLLIVDEAHQVVVEGSPRDRESLAQHSSRALRLENLVSKIIARKPDIVRIALTAVAGGAANPVARWIQSTDDAEPVGSYYRSTRQAIGVFEVRSNNRSPRITLDLLNDRLLAVRGRDESVFISLRIPPMPQAPPRIRNSLNHNTQNALLWNALHLTDRRILISIPQKPEDTIRWFADALSLEEWADAPRFVPPQDGEHASLFAEARVVCMDYCGANSHEVMLLDHGIATNHGQMPQRLRRMMVALVERSICRITVATATLTEGVNLPFDIIFLPLLKRTRFIGRPRPRQEEIPLSTSEFRNLAGRAGRPGAANSMEGMTLVAIPVGISTTAAGQRRTQNSQMNDRRREYDTLVDRLTEEAAGGGEHNSSLALLLRTLYDEASRLEGIGDEDDFLRWMEQTAPIDISEDAGTAHESGHARLADTLDELDGVIVSAIEEVRAVDDAADPGGDQAEAILAEIWQRTFARVSSDLEAWMERAFIKRGRGVVENVYPDAVERRKLYSYGFTPQIGRRFDMVAGTLLELLEDADAYGNLPDNERIAIFMGLGREVAGDAGYGYLVRDTDTSRNLFDNWPNVLGWWMNAAGAAAPEPDDLRAWQTFVADNFEFRLGIAVGAVVARRWTERSTDPFAPPTLATWKDVTELPWFAFWAKELLRWGTLEPLVAFVLSQGMARSRAEAKLLRPAFVEWLYQQQDLAQADDEDLIDPNHFMAWARSRRSSPAANGPPARVDVNLTGTSGNRGSYAVLPVLREDRVLWLDASGYEIAQSDNPDGFVEANPHRNDYELTTDGVTSRVRRAF
ncbi:DEAD/DEAH box helicase [Mesorhizobium sp. B2-6-4]|uniref:DEAD/DEAH box helicase n=1 Tax=Mesorhizobium sp. B2-6-4 TaxID=2589913 RepID=UPI001AEDFA61|nr:DEAD/DEAH box helicase [Mesorhizobium sp. B2-6-4]